MADAVPIHKAEEPKPTKKKDPKPATGEPKEVTQHVPAQPGNYYKMPDGVVVRDH